MRVNSPGQRKASVPSPKPAPPVRRPESIELSESKRPCKFRQLWIDLPNNIARDHRGSPSEHLNGHKYGIKVAAEDAVETASIFPAHTLTNFSSSPNARKEKDGAFGKIKQRIFQFSKKFSAAQVETEPAQVDFFASTDHTVVKFPGPPQAPKKPVLNPTQTPFTKKLSNPRPLTLFGAKSSMSKPHLGTQKTLASPHFVTEKPNKTKVTGLGSPLGLLSPNWRKMGVQGGKLTGLISPNKPFNCSLFKGFDHQRSLLLNSSGELRSPERISKMEGAPKFSKENLSSAKGKLGPSGRSLEPHRGPKRAFNTSILEKLGPKKDLQVKANSTSVERIKTEPSPHRDPERLIFGIRTRRGYDPDNCFKKNQDSFLAAHRTFKDKPMHIFGVCDGHGKQGEKVSEFLTSAFVANFNGILKDFEETGGALGSCGDYPAGLESLMYKALKVTISQLTDTEIDFFYSGSTFNAILIWNEVVYSCNVGDSRVILLKDNAVLQLSEDHKPDNPQERDRIKERGGVVGRSLDEHGREFGPLRVWAKGEDLPGLSLSRTVGDKAFESIGITWKPSFIIHRLDESDKMVFVLGSDGLFEVMSNIEVIKVVDAHWGRRNVEEACDALMEAALKRWKDLNYDSIDDITFVVVFCG